MIRIVLADDHTMVRDALKNMLQAEAGLEIVGEAADGLAALDAIRKQKPDILIVDVMMPNLNGLAVINRAKQEVPDTGIIVLSMRKSEPYIREAFHNGADGYVLKSENMDELIQAVHTVAAGKTYMSKQVAGMAADVFISRSQVLPADAYQQLTAREKEVLQLSAEGKSGEEIADILTLSVHTIATHRRNLMGKLGVKNQAELVNYALKRGIIEGG